MALPKRQHSKQRGRKRRTHQKLTLPSGDLNPLGNKGGYSHSVCPITGFYKGEQVLEIKPKKEKKKRDR